MAALDRGGRQSVPHLNAPIAWLKNRYLFEYIERRFRSQKSIALDSQRNALMSAMIGLHRNMVLILKDHLRVHRVHAVHNVSPAERAC
ncbi:MAG: hypothetical protein ACTSRN_09080, partial [Alphaproteobacteria bacterium]